MFSLQGRDSILILLYFRANKFTTYKVVKVKTDLLYCTQNYLQTVDQSLVSKGAAQLALLVVRSLILHTHQDTGAKRVFCPFQWALGWLPSSACFVLLVALNAVWRSHDLANDPDTGCQYISPRYLLRFELNCIFIVFIYIFCRKGGWRVNLLFVQASPARVGMRIFTNLNAICWFFFLEKRKAESVLNLIPNKF